MSDQFSRLQRSQKSRRETLAQWRASRLHELVLPSGMTVWVRDASMMDLMLSGRLPETVMEFANEQQGAAELDLRAIAKSAADFNALLNAAVLACVVEPPVAAQGDDDHLGLDEIGGDDKMAIFNWLNREVSDLHPFREGEGEPVAAVQPGDGLRPETE